MTLQCPSCKVEFVPPPGYIERKKAANQTIHCPICHAAIIKAREVSDGNATGD